MTTFLSFSHEEILRALGPVEERTHWPNLMALLHDSGPADHFSAFEISNSIKNVNGREETPLLWALKLRRSNPQDYGSLTASDLYDQGSEFSPLPLIRAAENPNPLILRALLLLKKWDPSKWWDTTTPLRTAVDAHLIENVRLLLAHGADANGVPLHAIDSWSARFLRFRGSIREVQWLDRKHYLDEIERAGFPGQQHASLTDDEINERRQYRAVFWAEVSIPPQLNTCIYMGPEPLALEVAAETGDCDLVDVLLDAKPGPDIQAWMQEYEKMPMEPSVSYLSPATPLHTAIQRGNVHMVSHLLAKGFSANVFPLASITCCLNPTMATIVLTPEADRMAMYEAINLYADLRLQSPVFNVHILHHAIATLDLDLIQRVEKDASLASAGRTSLGHTLLHIACLPRDQKQLNSISVKTNQSVHDFRTPLPVLHQYPQHSRTGTNRAFAPLSLGQQEFLESLTVEFPAQTAVLAHLISSPSLLREISAQDMHGNTALHYLTSYVVLNEAAITLFRNATLGNQGTDMSTDKDDNDNDNNNDNDNDNDIWATLENHWGYTAEQLYTDGAEAVQGWKERGGTSTWPEQLQRRGPDRWVAKTKSERQQEAIISAVKRRRDEERALGLPPPWRRQARGQTETETTLEKGEE